MNKRNSQILDYIRAESSHLERSANSTTLNKDARYIPCRSSHNESLVSLYRIRSSQKLENDSSNFLQSFEKAIFNDSENPNDSILNFRRRLKNKNPHRPLNEKLIVKASKSKEIVPYRIVETPNLQIFCFKKHLDWGKRDLISLYMNNSLYSYNEDTKDTEIYNLKDFELSVLKICDIGDFVLLSSCEGSVKLFDIRAQKEVSYSHPNFASPVDIRWISPVVGITFFKNGFIRSYDIRTDLKRNDVLFTNHLGISCADYSPDGQSIALGTKSGKIIFTDIRKLKEPPIELNCHTSGVKSLAFNPFRPSVVLSGGNYKDKYVHATNVYSKTKIKSIKLAYQINMIKFFTNVENFVIAHNHGKPDYALGIYSRHLKLIEKIDKKNKEDDSENVSVVNVAISPTQNKIVGTYESRVAKFWELGNIGKKKPTRKPSSSLELR